MTECPFRRETIAIKHFAFMKIQPKTDRYQQYQRGWVSMKQSEGRIGQKVPRFYEGI
jgi:hypothetical protein